MLYLEKDETRCDLYGVHTVFILHSKSACFKKRIHVIT